MCSLLTREAHTTRRSRHHARSAHHVPRAEHIVPKTKKQSTGLLSFLVAEVGFEPHDLRVMSPTSYQAALLRDIGFLICKGYYTTVRLACQALFCFFFVFFSFLFFHSYFMRFTAVLCTALKNKQMPNSKWRGICLLVPVTGIEPVRCFRITGF